MLMRDLLLVGALLTTFFAGCLAEDPAPKGVEKPTIPALLVPVTTPLWYHPQTFPHPAFNYPTLTNPPNGTIENKWLRPIPAAELPKPIVGLQHVAQVENVPRGTGMSVIGSIAILPANPTRFVDISDPTKPKLVGEFSASTRGSDTIVYPDGRIAAILATGGTEILALNITDPTKPTEFSRHNVDRTHKVDVVPGTPIVYNSARGQIVDYSDPETPVTLSNRMPDTCHRTYFYIEPKQDHYRAICAGYDTTQLWDIKDPAAPKLVVSINMWHGRPEAPGFTAHGLSHFAILSQNRKTLVVGDEMGGGGMMQCTAHASLPGRDVSVPTGALWFYDVSNEKSPSLKGWISPRVPWDKSPGSTCTSHHGRLVPDPEGKRDLLAMGYYGAGVILVDFTDPSNARILDQFNTNAQVWEAWYYNGYIVTGDMARGLDMLKLR